MISLSKIEKLMTEFDSRYRAVIVASKRAKQLKKGLRPLFESKSTKVTTMALEEMISGNIGYEIEVTVDPTFEPPEPDVSSSDKPEEK